MTPKLKGYLLTYLGWMLGTALAATAAYTQGSDTLRRFTDGAQAKDIFELLGYGLFFSFALVLALILYQVVAVIACPLITYLLLLHTHDRVVKTAVFQFGLLFMSPMFIVLSMWTDASVALAVYLTLFWLFLTPFLSRYLATLPAKPKNGTKVAPTV